MGFNKTIQIGNPGAAKMTREPAIQGFFKRIDNPELTNDLQGLWVANRTGSGADFKLNDLVSDIKVGKINFVDGPRSGGAISGIQASVFWDYENEATKSASKSFPDIPQGESREYTWNANLILPKISSLGNHIASIQVNISDQYNSYSYFQYGQVEGTYL